MTLLIFLAMLAGLILVHELGHFTAAKLSGVTIKEFGLGFPPRIFGIKRGETTYSLNAVPLGGFVKMVGEEDSNLPGSLASKNRSIRFAVLASGSFMNILLPILLLSASLMIPHQVFQERVIIQDVGSGSPAENAGIQSGDTVLAVDGHQVQNRGDVGYRIALRLGVNVNLLLQKPDSSHQKVQAKARWNPPDNQGAIGIAITGQDGTMITQSRPFWEAIPEGARTTWETMVLFKNEITAWFVRKTPPQIIGPVGIAQVAGEIAREGVSPLLRFAALLSVNLAIINLLPLPALDGGRLVFVMLEWIRRGRKVPPQKEGLIHMIGFATLMAAMILVTALDIMRIIQGESLIP
jgi:regulator of sigma E protease